MNRIIAAAVLLSGGLAWADPKYSQEQLDARFSYDLGPSEVDVSSYPEMRKQEYYLFRQACSQCHTLARALNSPIAKHADWKRFVTRMHLKDKAKGGEGFYKGEGQALIEFLAYDSQVRKITGKEAFARKSKELQALFEDVRKERARIRAGEDRKNVKEPPPGITVKPQP